MKKFIFKFPTTKKDKEIGASLLKSAMTCIETAHEFGMVDGIYTEQGVILMQKGFDLWDRAAKKFGFLSMADMEEYRQLHGHI